MNEQWEALCVRARLWTDPILPDPDSKTEDEEMTAYQASDFRHGYLTDLKPDVAGLALFARLMSILDCQMPEKRCPACSEAVVSGKAIHACVTPNVTYDGIPINDWANGNKEDYPGFFRMGGRALFEALRSYHAGTDRGELKALLVEAWGPSPSRVQTCTGVSATWCPIHGDCTCPYENDDPILGRTLDGATCKLHAPTSPHGEEPSDLKGLAARESATAEAPYYDPITGRCPHGTRYPHECRDGCES